jgi:hypothetical protein
MPPLWPTPRMSSYGQKRAQPADVAPPATRWVTYGAFAFAPRASDQTCTCGP